MERSVGACPDKLGSHRRAQVKHVQPCSSVRLTASALARRGGGVRRSLQSGNVRRPNNMWEELEDHEEELVLCKLKSQTWHSIWHSNTFPSKFFLVFSFFPFLVLTLMGFCTFLASHKSVGNWKIFNLIINSYSKCLFGTFGNAVQLWFYWCWWCANN